MNNFKTWLTSNFIIFTIIGSFTFVIDYLLYLQFLFFDIDFNIAKFISSSIAVILSYYLNSKFNFGKNNKTSLSGIAVYFIIYIVLILFHVLVNNILFGIFSNIHIAVLLAMTVSFIVNFVVINLYFKKKEKKCC